MGQYDVVLQDLLQQAALLPLPKDAKHMYAIAFDLDTQALQISYGKPSWQNAYAEIKAAMLAKGFAWQQGGVYFGDSTMTAVKCVLAVQAVSAALPWFKASVKDIRMLRIDEMNDLTPAL